MKTTKAVLLIRLFLGTVLVTTMVAATRAADQFVLVTQPGWTNSSQYSWTAAWGDYDNDGFIDLFVANSSGAWFPWTNFLYHNNGNETFTRKFPDQVGSIASDIDPSQAGYWGDVNNDGWIDLMVVNDFENWVTNRLYLNQGNGTFRSVDAGDLTKPSLSVGWGALADYDNDGFLDAFVCEAFPYAGHATNLLYHGFGDGRFSSVTNCVVATDQMTMTIVTAAASDGVWGDFNNDGKPDLIVANYLEHNFFYRNDGNGQFTRLTNSILEQYSSISVAWGDYDNDGFLDVAIVAGTISYVSPTRLFHNDGSGNFVLVTNWTTTSWPPVWGDYDNDGYLDLLVVGPGSCGNCPRQLRLLHNNGDGRFSPADDALTRVNGVWLGRAWGDYDNDGFLDLFIAEENGYNKLYNNVGNTNHWIKFQLEGTLSNRTAIGAKVRIKATIGGKTVWQMREVSGGNQCQNDLRPNFGLGDATNVDLVRIEWPSGLVQQFQNVPANQFLKVKEHQEGVTNSPSLSATWPDGGLIHLTLTGQTNVLYLFEASTDLTQWAKIAVRSNFTGTVDFTDERAAEYPRRFYRAVAP